MIRKIIVITVALMLLIGISVDPSSPNTAEAVTNFSLVSFDGFLTEINVTGSTDDGGGVDYVMFVYYGATGVITDTDQTSVPVGTNTNLVGYCDPGSGFPSDPGPCTVRIYDTTSNLGENDPSDLPAIFASTLLYPIIPVAQPAPQTGMISISTTQAQPVYESPTGNIIRDAGGNELWLPQDYDGSGADTHVVMSSADIDGRIWYEIWIGAAGSTVWVPADNVTVVE